MKIYRVIDKAEYRALKKYHKFLKRNVYISESFTTFSFNEVQPNGLFFFLNLMDAKEFGLDNLTDYYIFEIDIREDAISPALGVGLYLRCKHQYKFETLVSIDELNNSLSSLKMVAQIKNGVFISKIKPKLNYSERLCLLFLGHYNINLKCNTYSRFNGENFIQNSYINNLVLRRVC